MIRFMVGTAIVLAFIGALVLSDYVTRNLSQFLTTIL